MVQGWGSECLVNVRLCSPEFRQSCIKNKVWFRMCIGSSVFVVPWEESLPKPQVACSVHAGDSVEVPAKIRIHEDLRIFLELRKYLFLRGVSLCSTDHRARAGQGKTNRTDGLAHNWHYSATALLRSRKRKFCVQCRIGKITRKWPEVHNFSL